MIDKFADRGLRSLAVAYQVPYFPCHYWFNNLLNQFVLYSAVLFLGVFDIIVQEVPDGRKESQGGLWQFVGLMPLFDPPRHDSADTIRRALNLGVNVKMITGLHVSIVSSVITLELETCYQSL